MVDEPLALLAEAFGQDLESEIIVSEFAEGGATGVVPNPVVHVPPVDRAALAAATAQLT